MTFYQFKTSLKEASLFDGFATSQQLLAEPGCYAADVDFVKNNCGPLAQRFLTAVPDWYYQEANDNGLVCNCDIRLHDLEKGQYPASPGWHCDAAIRETNFGDKNHEGYQVKHNLIGCISSHEQGVSNTQFLKPEFEFESSAQYGNGAELWNEINQTLDPASKDIIPTEDGKLYLFDPWTLHRVAPAAHKGQRLFFRMSMWVAPQNHIPGIPKTEQVYRLLNQKDLMTGNYLTRN